MNVLDLPASAWFGQLLLGLMNGSFYALLSLGLAVVFGLLHVVNFAHGALYMLGAFAAWLLLSKLGLGYGWGIVLAPLLVFGAGMLLERTTLRPLASTDRMYSLLLTFGVALVLEGGFTEVYGVSGQPYPAPGWLSGSTDFGFMFLPHYRAWVVMASAAACLSTWLVIEKTRLGSYLRAATERPMLVQTFGVNVPLMLTLTYGFAVALAALAGVLAAPIYQVSPIMGSNLIITVFAIVVIGGMGSLVGAVGASYGLGLAEAVVKVVYPEGAGIVVFVIMALVLLARSDALFGWGE